jgi:hypothetical protein
VGPGLHEQRGLRRWRALRVVHQLTDLHGAPARRPTLGADLLVTVATFDGIFLQWLLDPEAIEIEALHRELRVLNEPARLRLVRKGH